MKTINSRTIEIFQAIDMIPRDSFKEQAISDYIKAWTEALGLEVRQDESFNLLIRKPASDGYEGAKPVVIQAHLDMVCEKHPESSHNFEVDPIILRRNGDWVESAVGTSIGADNAIGVATAMRILEDDSLCHPELEVVFTVREEVDFYGAEVFDGSWLRGRMLINLDFEIDDELIAGSCGGFGANFDIPVSRAEDAALKPFVVSLKGLIGGHSGEDIHNGRGNAIVMLARMIRLSGFELASIDAGTNRLAIPRDAKAVIYADSEEAVKDFFFEMAAELRTELGKNGHNLTVVIEEGERNLPPLDKESRNRVLSTIMLYPNGPMELSGDFRWTVENSDNLGIIKTEESWIKIVSEARGQHRSSFGFTEEKLKLLAEMVGAELEFFTRYEPWEFREESTLRETALSTYRELFGEEMKVLVLHAGLECSCFVSKYPENELDVIAIGPICENLHSPTERVSITSVEKHYRYLTALLENLK